MCMVNIRPFVTWVCLVSCLYGVPFVSARGCTYMGVSSAMFVLCTVRVRTRSYLHGCVYCLVFKVYRSCMHAVVLKLIEFHRSYMVYRLHSVSVVLPLLVVFHVCQVYAACL